MKFMKNTLKHKKQQIVFKLKVFVKEFLTDFWEKITQNDKCFVNRLKEIKLCTLQKNNIR